MIYDFIEVGTADFDTLAQTTTGSGISVEPVKAYLDRLPSRPNLRKVHAAVGDRAGRSHVYFIPDKMIAYHGLPEWVKGCNSVGIKHPTVLKLLTDLKLPHSLIRSVPVQVITVDRLFRTNAVSGVTHFKIDCEGMDTAVVKSLVAACDKRNGCWPERITFEANDLTPEQKVSEGISLLASRGYQITRSQNEILAER